MPGPSLGGAGPRERGGRPSRLLTKQGSPDGDCPETAARQERSISIGRLRPRSPAGARLPAAAEGTPRDGPAAHPAPRSCRGSRQGSGSPRSGDSRSARGCGCRCCGFVAGSGRCHPAGCPARVFRVNGPSGLASFGDLGEVHPETDFIVKLCALARGLISHIPECRDVPECSSTHRGDTASTPSLAPAPRSHRRDTLPPGTNTFQELFLASHPPGRTTRVPPQPIEERLPLPAGRNRRGLSRPKVNIGFSGAAAETRQRPSLSPARHRRGFDSPTGQPGRGGTAARPRALPGPAGLVLPCRSGHGTGVAAVSGSRVQVVALRGVSLLGGGRSWVVHSKDTGVLS